MSKEIFKEITAEDMWFGPVSFIKGNFSVIIYGNFVATVTLQCSFNNGKSWIDVYNTANPKNTFATNGQNYIYYRIGVKPGNYKSGTIYVRIGQN